MKPHTLPFLLLCAITPSVLTASISFNPGVTSAVYHTHATSDSVISFDWVNGDLFTMTSAGFPDVNIWRHDNSTTSNIYANPDNFAGSSVVAIGDYVYFNDSDFSNQYIRAFGPLNGTAQTAQVSTTANSGLYGHNGDLFITGAINFGTNRIFHSPLNVDGTLVNDPATDLGVTSGSSGPLAFDAVGNLFYAPGFSDLSIYRWSASQVAAAIADPLGAPLSAAGALWHDYSADYSGVSGATGMAIGPEGNLFVSLTDFVNPSFLVELGIDEDDAYKGTFEILESTSRLGDVRSMNGSIFVSAGNQIFEITAIPEPASFVLLAGLFSIAAVVGRRRQRA